MRHLRFSAPLLAGLVLLTGAARVDAQDDANLGAKETVLRVMQLSQELEKLLATLPPETQEELRGLLMDRLAAPAPDAKTAEEVSGTGADNAPAAVTAQASPETDRPSSSPDVDTTTAPTVAQIPKTPEPPTSAPAEPAPTEAAAGGGIASDPKSTAPETSAPDISIPNATAPGPAAQVADAKLPSPSAPAAAADSDVQNSASPPGPAATQDIPTPTPVISRRGACRTLGPFDTDGDGKLTGLDRYWRHFYLWTDVNENRKLDEREVESPYERGIREIDVALRSFVRGKGKRKRALEIQLEEHILLDVGGDGWTGADPRGDDGALAIDTSALRKAGGPDVRDSRGRTLEGVQPFRPGWVLRLTDGSEIQANCPKG
ncbi:MAG: hypothetical protein AAGM22_00850 [Acidobacteriota bacterium]